MINFLSRHLYIACLIYLQYKCVHFRRLLLLSFVLSFIFYRIPSSFNRHYYPIVISIVLNYSVCMRTLKRMVWSILKLVQHSCYHTFNHEANRRWYIIKMRDDTIGMLCSIIANSIKVLIYIPRECLCHFYA